MKRFSRNVLLFILSAWMTSCNLLDVDTVSDITNDDYWKSKGDVESYVYGIYTSFRGTVNSSALYHYEDRGDSFVRGLTGGPSTAWNQDLSGAQGVSWASFYTVIQHCNNLIKNAETVRFAIEAEKNSFLAEAYFIRAYMYFCVVRSFGDAPLELIPTESSKKEKLPRSPADEVMKRILEDVDLAIKLFGTDGYPNGKSRASRPACYALKADALLWKYKVLKTGSEQDLKDIITLADQASAGLSLDKFPDIFATKKGPEIIFSVHFDINEQVGQYSNQLKPKESHISSAVNKDQIAWAKTAAGTTYRLSEQVVNIFDNPMDIRKVNSIIEAVDADHTSIGWFDNKMRGTEASGDRAYDNDIVIYRLAEMYLFKAEAYAALNEIENAMKQMNLVRDRACTGDYSGPKDKQAIEKAILDERFREFYLERKRWPDLVRFHYGGTINVYTVVPNLKGKESLPLFFPIPQKDIDLNPKLEQTEGYETIN